MEWYKNPTILVVAGVGIFAAIILLRSQNTTQGPQISNLDTSGQTPVGGSYQYLDGNGVQHLIATDPNSGALNYYATMSPPFPGASENELASYVGSMSHGAYMQPYGGTTPYYSQLPQYGQLQ